MQALDTFHHLDGIILAALVAGVGLGARVGVVRPALWLACAGVSAYTSAYLQGPAAEQVGALLDGSAAGLAPPAALVGTFTASYVSLFVATALVRKVLRRCRDHTDGAVNGLGLRPSDRLAGAAVGCALAALLAGSAVLGLALCPEAEARAGVGGSRLRPHVAGVARAVLAAVPERSRAGFETALRRLERAGADAAGQTIGVGLDALTDEINGRAAQLEQSPQAVRNAAPATLRALVAPAAAGQPELPLPVTP